MFEAITIQSHKGPYTVTFHDAAAGALDGVTKDVCHFLVDRNVARLHAAVLHPVVSHGNTVFIDATEDNKSIERIIPVFERLVGNGIRRDHVLVAIGGGIIQDIACFVASTLLRGLTWRLVPPTLLAQADSCIGSKSSINLGKTKNILGTFNPPSEIAVCAEFLDTLEDKDIRSGIGEILKVHAIDSPAAFDRVAADYEGMKRDRQILLDYIGRALLIKQRYIEVDEFDRGVRNIFNYGHSFGHAIEAATDFGVPHGVAVTMGMDMANCIAAMRGLITDEHFRRMHRVLRKNYEPFARVPIPLEPMFSALLKDKKNTSTEVVVILPVGNEAAIQRVAVAPDFAFQLQCRRFLEELYA